MRDGEAQGADGDARMYGQTALTTDRPALSAPLDEFTAARNALAKETGDSAIKKLEKPNLAAWAVNQLYWPAKALRRGDQDLERKCGPPTSRCSPASRRTCAAPRRSTTKRCARPRTRFAQMLEGGGNIAVRRGDDAGRRNARRVADDEPPGRLTKPLRRTGFNALQGVHDRGEGRAAAAESGAGEACGRQRAISERKKREAEQRELAMAKERLRFAEAAEREAEAHARAREAGAGAGRADARARSNASSRKRSRPRRARCAKERRPARRRSRRPKAESERLSKEDAASACTSRQDRLAHLRHHREVRIDDVRRLRIRALVPSASTRRARTDRSRCISQRCISDVVACCSASISERSLPSTMTCVSFSSRGH